VSKFRSLALCAGLTLTLALPAAAAPPVPTTLDPIQFGAAQLVVQGPEGAKSYDPAMLEQELQTYRLVTTTPWRQEAATFEGVMLHDVLERHGLTGTSGIKVTAENDFEVTIPAELIAEVPILIATRVDGQPHTRRARGPLQFVIPMDIYEELGLTERYWVWMAARIEAAE